MQSVSSRIWTRVTVSISCDYNHYTTGTSIIVCVCVCVLGGGAFVDCKVGDLHPVTSKWKQTSYHNVLQDHALSSGKRLMSRQGFVLMQDKEPKHINKICQRYIKGKEEQHLFLLMS